MRCLFFIFRFFLIIVLINSLTAFNALASEGYSLQDLYRIGLERSERIKISEEDIYISEKGKDKALAILLPRLSAFGSYTKYSDEKHSSTGSTIQPSNSTSWGLRLDYSLSLSGRELTALNISKEGIEKTRFDLWSVKENYLFNIAAAYYELLKIKKSVEIAKANVERLKRHKNAAQIRLKVGEVTKTDLLRVEAELSGAQAEMIKAENNLILAKAVLARLVGIEKDFDIKDASLDSGDELRDLLSLKKIAIENRAELKSLELQKQIAEQQIRYVKGAYWPTISVEGVYSRKDESPSSAFLNKESIYGGIRLNFPFFEGGLRKAEVSEAKARKRQVDLVYEDTRKTISIEVEEAYLNYLTQKGVLQSLMDRLTFAMDNYNSVSRQYEFGLANSIDVIDANTLFLTSERQVSEARYNYQLSIIKLRRASGVLLDVFYGNKPNYKSELEE